MALLFGLGNNQTKETASGTSSPLLFGLNSTPSAPVESKPKLSERIATNLLENNAARQSAPIKTGPTVTELLNQNAVLTKQDPNNIKSTDYKARFLAPVEDLPWYMRPGRVANDTIKQASEDLFNRFQEVSSAFQSDGTLETRSLTTKEKVIDRISKVGSLGLGFVNTAFLPFTAPFKGAEEFPVFGDVFKGLNTFIGKVGEVGGHIGEVTTDALPVSDQTKKAIKPVLQETFGLLTQFALGKIAHDTVKSELKPLKGEMERIIAEDRMMKERAAKSEAEAVKNAPKEPIRQEATPAEISKLVENSLEKNPTGVREKSVSYLKENPAEITSSPIKVREVDGRLVIEDGRHRLNAARDLNLPSVTIEDVTPQYTGKPSAIIESMKPKEVAGTGETKVRGLSKGVEASAVAEKLTKGFSDLPEYETMNVKEQGKLASDLLRNDYEQAKRVALGQEPAPQGLHPEAVFTAVEMKAIKDRDIATLKSLATKSSLTTEATTMGQRIKLLDERNPDSPVKAMRDIARAREEAVKKRVKGSTKEVKNTAKEIKSEIDKVKPKKQNWVEFIKEIQC